MSRRPQPLEARVAKGNPTRRPIPKDAPQRIAGDPALPATLSKPARKFWPGYCETLRARGQLSRDSAHSLELLCETAAEVQALREDCEKRGRFQAVKTKSGDVMERMRPAYASLMDASRRLLALLTEFGLTDASRGKVSGEGPGEKPEDDAERYGLH